MNSDLIAVYRIREGGSRAYAYVKREPNSLSVTFKSGQKIDRVCHYCFTQDEVENGLPNLSPDYLAGLVRGMYGNDTNTTIDHMDIISARTMREGDALTNVYVGTFGDDVGVVFENSQRLAGVYMIPANNEELDFLVRLRNDPSARAEFVKEALWALNLGQHTTVFNRMQ